MIDDKIKRALDEAKKAIRYVDDQGKRFQLSKQIVELERRAAAIDALPAKRMGKNHV
jgi:hypothetical protein